MHLRRFALAPVALLPWELVALRTHAAADVMHARAQLRLAWALAATAWIPALWLVEPRASTIKPVLLAAVAIALGCLAGGVPGLVLVVLLAWTAAEGSPEASAAAVRARWQPVALAVGATVLVMLAIPLAMQLVLLHPLPRKPPPAAFAGMRTVVRATVAALVVACPLAGWAISRTR